MGERVALLPFLKQVAHISFGEAVDCEFVVDLEEERSEVVIGAMRNDELSQMQVLLFGQFLALQMHE